ncbi:4-hydroxy-2-oxovalerate aldolase [Corynebacterium rouxii]|uniref:4-hydroxy-2-oxovalerate aldolase n=1 Tax=Corynebacterium rouxii TaxID=2719119 RepID=A0ABU3PQT7_9CORY|nr:4-hydroxy-2-oxovalerate aldolase [Corynebacterium rouxii]MDT9409582.1 4-hydroxy-2-oxovalerate aldolase [Corynebacterium rouxii]MDT9411815.1 4-hydroxy-2-oxovalerate aldolase [Corynebacterium rouxii]
MTDKKIRFNDTTLRDGSHAVRHQYTPEQVRAVVRALDDAHVEMIEVTHGDGLGGSTFNYGFSKTNEFDLIEAAVDEARNAKIAALLLPGLGRVDDIKEAHKRGISMLRVATHCTEADISIQHFQAARELGLETGGFLMLSHRAAPQKLAEQARIMVDAGCQCVFVVDSAGALIMEEASDRVAAVLDEIGSDAQVGFHGHQNMSFGVANSVLAARAGAQQIDGTLYGLGAGAGNAPIEVLATAFECLEFNIGEVDVAALQNAAEDVLLPMVDRLPMMDRASIIQGQMGVYNSFLFHAERAEQRYGVPAHAILREVGRRGYVGGQEDMIIDVAVALKNQ